MNSRSDGGAKDPRKARGAAGEAAAAAYLASRGYEIISRNWRCRFGEVDIIAQTASGIVFAEVRTRSAASLHAFGTPLESITPRKQQTLRRCAQAYLSQYRSTPDRQIRFDCIGVVLDESDQPVDMSHIKDAF